MIVEFNPQLFFFYGIILFGLLLCAVLLELWIKS